ncbi:hypothetical protein HHI36_000404 [Cryptolaemus montrouzieri]|uniref:PiggyBac transposable element-derived protein domain-containing protein n=1 Tax=Cryptolaemus montrouzieri TaxID=559131 RepID=A0ABD2P4K5_9CUCU
MLKQDRGTYDFRTDSENTVCLVRQKDNKVVTCATNFDTTAETKCSRWSEVSKGKISVTQPNLFVDYIHGMGGVDKWIYWLLIVEQKCVKKNGGGQYSATYWIYR